MPTAGKIDLSLLPSSGTVPRFPVNGRVDAGPGVRPEVSGIVGKGRFGVWALQWWQRIDDGCIADRQRGA